MNPINLAGVAAALLLGSVASLSFSGNLLQDKPATGGSKAGAEQGKAESKPARTDSKVEVPFLGNEKCPMTGEAIDRKASAELDGQLVYFCCTKCLAKGKQDAKATAAKAYPADKVVDLKNTVCPVMGEPNGEDQGKYSAVVMGRKMYFCCDSCPDDVKAAPGAYLAKALNPKLAVVGNTKDPVTQKEPSRFDIVVYKGKIVRVADAKSIEQFQKEPDKYLETAEADAKNAAKAKKH